MSKKIQVKVNLPRFLLVEEIHIKKSNDSTTIVFDSSFEGGRKFTKDSIKNFLNYYKEKLKSKKVVFLTMNERASSFEDGIIYKNYAWELYINHNYQRVNLKKTKYSFTYLGGYSRPDKCMVFNKLFKKDLLSNSVWSFSGPNKSIGDDFITSEARKLLPMSHGIDFLDKEGSFAYKKSWSLINKKLYNSRFSLVQETEMSNISNRYTEKTFKCLVIGHPFIIAGNYQVLKLLRKDGFKTFSPYIDESYDEVEDANERINLIIKEVDRLCQMDKKEWYEFLINIEPILEYNFQKSTNYKISNVY